eukprot:1770021-Prymnesium_polylepis.1
MGSVLVARSHRRPRPRTFLLSGVFAWVAVSRVCGHSEVVRRPRAGSGRARAQRGPSAPDKGPTRRTRTATWPAGPRSHGG